MEKVECQSYILRTESGQWLGQVVLTSDGMFSGVTDYGTSAYAWRSFGGNGLQGFKEFICTLNKSYFADKMFTGAQYMVPMSKKFETACGRFAEHILPALQKAIKEEFENKDH